MRGPQLTLNGARERRKGVGARRWDSGPPWNYMIISVHAGYHAYPTRAAFKINASRGIIDCAKATRESGLSCARARAHARTRRHARKIIFSERRKPKFAGGYRRESTAGTINPPDKARGAKDISLIVLPARYQEFILIFKIAHASLYLSLCNRRD